MLPRVLLSWTIPLQPSCLLTRIDVLLVPSAIAQCSSSFLQANACYALAELAQSQEHREAIKEAGGVEVMKAAMAAHPNDNAVQISAACALAELTPGNPGTAEQ